MGDAPLMLGVSGLRGIVGESLTPEVATRYAAAFGAWLARQVGRRPYVLIGRDGRAGGEPTYTAAISGLLATGCRVCRLGVSMTPTHGVLCDAKRADAALIVTASHNPQEWNGLKILVRRESWSGGESDGRAGVLDAVSDACAPDATTASEIIAGFREGHIDWAEQDDTRDSTVEDDVEHPHCLRVLEACGTLFGVENFWDMIGDGGRYTVAADSVNASSVVADAVFFEDTPCRLIQLHGEQTGLFPHPPEPTAANLSGAGGLCDAVPGLGADVGFAQDPDADRLAIIDENGRYIGEEYTLALAAWSVLSAKTPSVPLADSRDTSPAGVGEDGPVLCTNLSTSRMIDDIAAKYGGRVVRTPVGEANVVGAMKREGAVLGGEGNGGVIWPAVTYVRDSLGSMALVLALMARTGKKVSGLVAEIDALSGGGYAIEKRKTPIANKEAADPACDAVAAAWANQKLDRQDGLRVDWSDAPHGGGAAWLHVRASNTEPIMRLICEAGSPDQARAILDDAERAIAGS